MTLFILPGENVANFIVNYYPLGDALHQLTQLKDLQVIPNLCLRRRFCHDWLALAICVIVCQLYSFETFELRLYSVLFSFVSEV